MLLLKTKLMIESTNVIFNNGQNALFKIFRTNSDQSCWKISVFVNNVNVSRDNVLRKIT